MSDFNKNLLMLLSGSAFAQALPIVMMPILTRIYSPQDFGILALFVAITSILGSIANARYELAIALPAKDDESITVAALSILICTIFCFLLCVPFIFFNETLVRYFELENIRVWLYLVPIVVWLIGIFNVFNFLNTRYKKFKAIATAQVYRSIFMLIFQLVIGVFKSGSLGLIIGQIVGHLTAVMSLAKRQDVKKIYNKLFKFEEMVRASVRYKKFVIYMLPATIMNSFSSNFVTLYLPSLFSLSTLGFYSLAQRTMGIPSALIGSSISQVYLQDAASEKKTKGNIKKSFINVLKKLVIFSLIFFVPLYFFVEDIFAIAFGEQWRQAGQLAVILIPYFFINFIVSALSVTDTILEKQYIYYLFNIILVIGAISITFYMDFQTVENFLRILTSYFIFCYLIYFTALFYIIFKNG